MKQPIFLFGDIVVVRDNQIGVILKTWDRNMEGNYYYEVYNRMNGLTEEYYECEIERYRVRHKYLNEEEVGYQNGRY